MPLDLQKVPYGGDVENELTRLCLDKKAQHVKDTAGIGPHSCCAILEIVIRGQTRYIFGNSQIKNPIASDIYKNPHMRCHGEASALMTALERAQTELNINGGDLAALISRVYIEMSPCDARCKEMLENVNPNMTVLYSFDHPGEVSAWEAAASDLCS